MGNTFSAETSELTFESATFESATFESATFESATFESATFESATFESLLKNSSIRSAIFAQLGPPEMFVLRHVLRGIKRPRGHPMLEFLTESNLKLVKWALEQHELTGLPPYNKTWPPYDNHLVGACKAAAALGRVDVIEIASKDAPCKLNFEIARAAARVGEFKIVKWLHKTGRIVPVLPLGERQYGGDAVFPRTVEFGYCGVSEHIGCRCTLFGELIFKNVAKTGDLKMFKWLYKRGYYCSDKVQCAAAKHGHVLLLEYMRNKCHVFDSRAQHVAKDTRVLEYLDRYGAVNSDAYNSAAKRGLVKIMDWLRSNGFVPRYDAMREALRAGQKEAVEWLVSYGMQLGEPSTAHAAYHSLDMVMWVMARGAPWSVYVCPNAVNEGNYDIVDFAERYSLPFNRELCRQIRRAIDPSMRGDDDDNDD
jgi:hypothetical protein